MSYNEYINNILKTRGRFNCKGYKERHHIIPKCLKGTNDEDNLIDLYPQEHFIAHKLLHEEYPSNMGLCTAYFRMCFKNGKSGIQVSPEEYAIAREKYSLLRKQYFKGEKNPFYGKHHTEETKQKISNKKYNPSKELRKKLSDAQKQVDHSYQIECMANANRGKYRPISVKQKISKTKQLSGTGNNKKDKVKITNGEINKFVSPHDIHDWFSKGFVIANENQLNKYFKLLEEKNLND